MVTAAPYLLLELGRLAGRPFERRTLLALRVLKIIVSYTLIMTSLKYIPKTLQSSVSSCT